MKKLILILTLLTLVTMVWAQKPGKADTLQKAELPRLEDLLKKLEEMAVDSNGYILSTRFGCRDVYQPGKMISCDILERITAGTPYGSITYKPDTIQHRTFAYKTNANTKLDTLLRVLTGFDIDPAGILTHQGSKIVSFKVGGDPVPSTNIRAALRYIPANAIEMVEIVDDYSTVTARTGGGRSPNPDKHLNVTLKKGKSIDLKKLRTCRSK